MRGRNGLRSGYAACDNGEYKAPRDAVNARGLADWIGVDVSSMPRVVPEDDILIIESLDWDLACEVEWHPGAATPPHAQYAVWLKQKPCGCPPLRDFLRCCAFHWEVRFRQGLFCIQCGNERILGDSISHVERI